MTILFTLERDSSKQPERQTEGAAGYDCYADILRPINIRKGETRTVPLGFRIQLPEGYEAQMRSRSGMAANKSIFILNSPGTIDWDYRGELRAILHNSSSMAFTVMPGDRVCQLVINKVEIMEWIEVETLEESERGDGGYGSTGS